MELDFGVVVHGGAGTGEDLSDGCRSGCLTAFRILEEGGTALDAVTEACRVLEDDGRFNAGIGSVLRIDGRTIEMDAAVMDSGGNLGMVVNIRGVRNPVTVALGVTRTPHVALAGRGAEAFAEKIGAAPFTGISEKAAERHERVRALMKEGRLGELNPLWKGIGQSFFEGLSCDTIGAVAVDRKGIFAVGTSTGGALPMLVGRVGDTPMIGCGFYSGPSGAVAATGIGEEIIRRMLAKKVYDGFGSDGEVFSACKNGVGLFPQDIPVGLIGITGKGYGVSSNRSMAHYVMVKER